MHWIGKILLLLLLQSLTLLKAKRRKREAKEAVDPLLSLVFSTPEHKDETKVKETRPGRAISPDEELAALLEAVDKRTNGNHANIQEKRSAYYPQAQPISSQVTDSTQASMSPSTPGASAPLASPEVQSVSELMNVNARSSMPQPEPMVHNQQPVINPNPQEMENAGLVPRTMPVPMAQPAPFQPIQASSVADVPSQQTVPGFSSTFAFNNLDGFAVPGQQKKTNTTAERKSTISVPSSNPEIPGEGMTFFVPDSKKSSIPIPVKMQTGPAIINKFSEPLQLRKISPNMRLRGVVPHNPEYGETVESITKATDFLRRSGVPRPIYLPQIIFPPVKKSTIPSPPQKTEHDTTTVKKTETPYNLQPLTPYVEPSGQSYGYYQHSPDIQTVATPPRIYGPRGLTSKQVKYYKPEHIKQYQLEQSGMLAQPKPVAADECEDQYPGPCVDFEKNNYCTKFPDLMKIQCRKSCHFCTPEKETAGVAKTKTAKSSADQEASGSASGSGSGTMASGSGEEDTEGQY